MENNEVKPWHLLIFTSLCLVMIYMIYSHPIKVVEKIENNCKEDSLRLVIEQLQSELQVEEDGWDKRENRYENVIFEYEYGISYLKENHPSAYKDFHRIIGYRERYSHELERDNKKRLSIENGDTVDIRRQSY